MPFAGWFVSCWMRSLHIVFILLCVDNPPIAEAGCGFRVAMCYWVVSRLGYGFLLQSIWGEILEKLHWQTGSRGDGKLGWEILRALVP